MCREGFACLQTITLLPGLTQQVGMGAATVTTHLTSRGKSKLFLEGVLS